MAAVVRGDYGGGVVYLGHEPELVLSGGVGETQLLEKALTILINSAVTYIANFISIHLVDLKFLSMSKVLIN